MKLEACEDLQVFEGVYSAFFGAFSIAYNKHLPLSLSPDAVWLTILQGLTAHIGTDPEGLRHHFVSFQGKQRLHIIRNEFVKGSKNNDWPGCFAEFTEQMKQYIGKRYDLLVSNFSTTGLIEKASSEISLMSAMKHYFDYSMSTCCGFPSITIEGEPKDWEDIITRTRALGEFGLTWWTDHLLPVLNQFLSAAKGAPNPAFWRNAYDEGGGSGGPFISGWINAFFPYMKGGKRNAALLETPGRRRIGSGNRPDDFPTSILTAPVTWFYHSLEFELEFWGGLVGVTFDNGIVRPAAGWAVVDIGNEPRDAGERP